MNCNPYEVDLDKTPANYAPLTPLSFLDRAAFVYPNRVSVIHGRRTFTWKETYARCRRLASALSRRGIARGDTVAVMLANTPEMYEAHFGVPMTQAVLNTLNTRLEPASTAFMLQHAEARVLIADREFAPVVEAALARLERRPLVVDVADPEHGGPGTASGELGYEALLAEGDASFRPEPLADEWQAISLNYTSGTTGNPKGVVYHHRGAYLNALSNVLAWGMGP